MSTRSQARSLIALEQAPEATSAAPIRDRLAFERQRLDALDPDALDLTAEILASLHNSLRGEVTALAGDRTGRYRRAQLLGASSLPLEDIVYLWRQQPEAVAIALAPLVEVPFATKIPLSRIGGDLAADTATFTRDLLAALEGGRITRAEAEQLGRDLSTLHEAISEARTALAAVRGSAT